MKEQMSTPLYKQFANQTCSKRKTRSVVCFVFYVFLRGYSKNRRKFATLPRVESSRRRGLYTAERHLR